MTLYQFYKRVYDHYFCPTCGVQLILKDVRREDGKKVVEVNVRTVDDVDVQKLKWKVWDGKTLL